MQLFRRNNEAPRHVVEQEGGARCPCCGAGLDPHKIAIDLDSNCVAWGGRRWRCAPQVVEFLYAVVSAWPRAASYDALAHALWGMGDWPEERNTLAVNASRARRVLRHMGADIKSAPGRGYRLVLREAAVGRTRIGLAVWLALAAGLLPPPAAAQTYLQLHSTANRGTEAAPIRETTSFTAWVNEDRNLRVIVTASDPAGVAQIILTGNGKLLADCATEFDCWYEWSRAAMRSGDNNVVVRVVNKQGAVRVSRAIVSKPL